MRPQTLCAHKRELWGLVTRRLPDVLAERARFELANRVRRLRHFQCRALDQTRRPLRGDPILPAAATAGTAALACGPAFEVEDRVDHREARQPLRKVTQRLPGHGV